MMGIDISVIMFMIGLCIFMVSMFTELFKDIPPLNTIHTKYVAIVLSMIVTNIMWYACIDYYDAKFVWYTIFIGIGMALCVAYIAMYGWDKFNELWNKSKGPKI